MLFFQCLLIWPIWWVAWQVRNKNIAVQIVVNLAFYVGYSIFWFGPVQDAIEFLYNHLQSWTRSVADRQVAYLDRGYEYSFLNYQLLKHCFRLSWFYLANYFYNYLAEEKNKIALAIANRNLQLKLLTWHLNPSFYFKTISYLQKAAAVQPSHATKPILQLAKVMDYVIYQAREPLIEMKKEIEFLENYIALLNGQSGGDAMLKLNCGPGYEKYLVTPLLLTGILDSIITIADNKEEHLVEAKFYDGQLCFSITNIKAAPPPPELLAQLYCESHRYWLDEENILNLQLQLHEA